MSGVERYTVFGLSKGERFIKDVPFSGRIFH